MKRLPLLLVVVLAYAGVGVTRAPSSRSIQAYHAATAVASQHAPAAARPETLGLPRTFRSDPDCVAPGGSHDGETRDEANEAQRPAILRQAATELRGQRGPGGSKVAFLSRSAGRSLSLSATEAVLTLRQPNEPSVVRMTLVAANTGAKATAQDELPGKIDYFIGNDPTKWHTNVSTHATVRYEGVYPGIDLVYYGNEGRLEYDFVVSPGAHPEAIALSFEGAGAMRVDNHGDLVLNNAGGDLRWKRPVVYQQAGDVRQEISGRYVQSSGNQVWFEVGPYDPQRALDHRSGAPVLHLSRSGRNVGQRHRGRRGRPRVYHRRHRVPSNTESNAAHAWWRLD